MKQIGEAKMNPILEVKTHNQKGSHNPEPFPEE